MSEKRGFMAYESKHRVKVYLACSTLVPVFTGGEWHGFAEPVDPPMDRIPVRPGRYVKLPILIPFGVGRFCAWGIFDRRVGGKVLEVMIAPEHAAPIDYQIAVMGADGRIVS